MRKYNTRQRERILELFTNESERCFSAKEIYALCADVGQATVYRTLSMLEREGRIKRYRTAGGDCFKLSSLEKADCHVHFACKSCGEIIHSECNFITEVAEHLKKHHDFSLDITETVIYGICGKCAEEFTK